MLTRFAPAPERGTVTGPTSGEDPIAPTRRAGEPARWHRLAGISASLVGTSAVTSILGLGFWAVAARTLDTVAVGVAGAAVALMMLVGAFGTLGLGTLLISRLPAEPPGTRRRLVRSSLGLSGGVAGALSLVTVWPVIALFHMDHLRPVVSGPAFAFGFAVATALTAVTMVLDQAVLVLGIGALQLERNLVASIVKIVALIALTSLGARGGMTVVAAWTLGNLVSLPLVAFRTRGGHRLEDPGPLIDLRVLRRLGREAISHHALNTGLQLPLQLLPVVVTVMLSARTNGYFSTALLVTGFVFTLPYAVSVGLFAAAEGDEHEVLRRLRWTVPFGLAVSLAANLVLYPAAGVVLGVFGHGYAVESTPILHVLVLAGLPFVVKDHYVALRRVQRRTTEAAVVIAVFGVVELVAAAAGAHWGGVLGLSWAWVGLLILEAAVFTIPLLSGAKALHGLVPSGPTTLPMGIPLDLPRNAPVAPHLHRPLEKPPEVPPPMSIDALIAANPPDGTSAAGPPRSFPVGRHAVRPQVQPNPRPGSRPKAQDSERERDLLAVVLVLMGAGLAVAALTSAYARVRPPSAWVGVFYAVGLAMMFLPAAGRVLHTGTASRERVVLGVALPALLQLVRFVLHPDGFAHHDELVHQNTLRLIAETHHLFGENPLLPVSGYYPGLEIATHAVGSLTGLSPFAGAFVVLLLARLVIAAALMALIASLTHSLRLAAIVSVLYTCNPQLIFFNSQFSYQTLALPLAVLTVYLLFTMRNRRRALPLAGTVAILVAVSVTHHMTSMLLLLTLLLWTGLELALGRRRRAAGQGPILAAVTAAGFVVVGLAMSNPGNPVGGYLLDIARSSQDALGAFGSGESRKALFVDSAGSRSQLWERMLMVYSVMVVGLALVPAMVRARTWWQRRAGLALVLVLSALLYPLIPLGHVTRVTAEVGDRSAGFVFFGVAFVLAWAVRDLPIARRWAVLGGVAATGVFVGNVILGAGPVAAQLPGPFRVAADARSLDPHNLATARWVAENLPPGSRVYADRDSGLLAAAVGRQYTVRHVSTGVDASRLLLDPRFTPEDVAVAREAQIAYLIVDQRDATSLPHVGVYVEEGEYGLDTRTHPVPRAALSKLDRVVGVQRIYDDGSLVIYDIRRMSGVD